VAERGLAQAATDITGFGLLGHLGSMCRASQVGAKIRSSSVPVLAPEVLRLIGSDCIPGGSRDNLRNAERITRWRKVEEPIRSLLADAQTSGGLLLCVRPKNLSRIIKLLRRYRSPSAVVIGEIVHASRPQIEVVP